MADAVDKANDQVSLHMGNLLKVRKRFCGDSATECEKCGNPIPSERQEAIRGVKLCVDCQEKIEVNRARFWL